MSGLTVNHEGDSKVLKTVANLLRFDKMGPFKKLLYTRQYSAALNAVAALNEREIHNELKSDPDLLNDVLILRQQAAKAQTIRKIAMGIFTLAATAALAYFAIQTGGTSELLTPIINSVLPIITAGLASWVGAGYFTHRALDPTIGHIKTINNLDNSANQKSDHDNPSALKQRLLELLDTGSSLSARNNDVVGKASFVKANRSDVVQSPAVENQVPEQAASIRSSNKPPRPH